MGITSVDLSSEEDGFGKGELTDTENPITGVANDSTTPLDFTSVQVFVLALTKTRGGTGVLVWLRSSTA